MGSPTRVAIAGFTGKLARHITARLLTHGGVEVHGICRDAKSQKISGEVRADPRVRIFEAGPRDADALREALAGCSVCICCYLGDDEVMVEGQKALVDACVAAGVARYVASDWTLDYREIPLGAMPQKDPMKRVRAYLEAREARGEISGVHILNGVLMEVFWAPFIGWVDPASATFRVYGSGDEPLDLISYKDAGEFTAEVALNPRANGFQKVLGDVKSLNEVAALYEKVYGVKPTVETVGTFEQLKEQADAAFAADPANIYSWIGANYQYYLLSEPKDRLGSSQHGEYKLAPDDMEAFMRRYTKDTIGSAAFF